MEWKDKGGHNLNACTDTRLIRTCAMYQIHQFCLCFGLNLLLQGDLATFLAKINDVFSSVFRNAGNIFIQCLCSAVLQKTNITYCIMILHRMSDANMYKLNWPSYVQEN